MRVKVKVNRLFMKAGQEYEVYQADDDCVYIKGDGGVLACVDYSEVEDMTNPKAYDIEKRRHIEVPVVAKLRNVLKELPGDAALCIGGIQDCYVHVSKDSSIVTIDCCDLQEEYDERVVDCSTEFFKSGCPNMNTIPLGSANADAFNAARYYYLVNACGGVPIEKERVPQTVDEIVRLTRKPREMVEQLMKQYNNNLAIVLMTLT